MQNPNQPNQSASSVPAFDTIDKRHAGFENLVQTYLGPHTVAFQTWQAKNANYNRTVLTTGQPGSAAGMVNRGTAQHEARMARLEFLAPLAMASQHACQTAHGQPLLSEDEWRELALHKNPSLVQNGQQQTNTQFKEAVEKSVEDLKKGYPYNGLQDGVFTADQYNRAVTKTKERHASVSYRVSHSTTVTSANNMFKRIGGLFSGSSKEEATQIVDADYEAMVLKNLKANDPNFDPNKQPDVFKKAVKDEKESKPGAYEKCITDKTAEIDAGKKAVKEEMAYAKDSYHASVDDVAVRVEAAMELLNIAQQDALAHNKANPSQQPLAVIDPDLIKETLQGVDEQEKETINSNFHEHARRYEEQFVKAGKMGRYDAQIYATRETSEQHKKTLSDLAENKDPDKPLTVNGIPCEHVASIQMWGMKLGSSWFGTAWGGKNRTKDMGKFMEAFLVETTEANTAAYQKMKKTPKDEGKTFTVEEMLKAYSNAPHNPPKSPNANMESGTPVNAFHINSFPINAGAEATLRAFAELMAMAEVLKMAIDINIDAVVQSAPAEFSGIGKDLKHLFMFHLGNNDKYMVEARQQVAKEFTLSGSDEDQQKLLIQRLTGSLGGSVAAIQAQGKGPSSSAITATATANTTQGTPAPTKIVPAAGTGNPSAASGATPAPSSTVTLHTANAAAPGKTN